MEEEEEREEGKGEEEVTSILYLTSVCYLKQLPQLM
jgi:hypothetical protein